MKELKEFAEIKKLKPFTEILFVDKEKCTLDTMLFLYVDGSNCSTETTFYTCNTGKRGAPKERNFKWYENRVYLDWTYDEYKQIENELKEKSILQCKLRKIKDEHWGYVKGKLTCFWVNTAAWKLEDINGKDVNYTVDDIESICLNKPKFEDVKKFLPNPGKDAISGCYMEKWKGSELNNIKYSSDEFRWYYVTLQYKPDKEYKVYAYCTSDAEGYCYTHYVYIDD
jgi:hypothetical protein